jgi:hypothetical protein
MSLKVVKIIKNCWQLVCVQILLSVRSFRYWCLVGVAVTDRYLLAAMTLI